MSYFPTSSRAIRISGLTVGASGSPADRGSVLVPGGLARWRPMRAWIVCVSASGSLALAVFEIRTAASGAGTALVAGLTTTALTTADKFADFTLASLTDALTATTLYARQTTDSLNAGTADIFVELVPV